MAAYGGFALSMVYPFNKEQFPEYCCTGRRGRGNTFRLDGAMTHVFFSNRPPARLFQSKYDSKGTCGCPSSCYI